MNKIIAKNKDDKEVEIPFTMVSNFSLDTIHLRTPAENCLYFVIIRQTIGYLTQSGERKKNASLSISRLMQLTNLSRQGVLNSRRKLFENRWIMYKLFGGMTSYAVIDRYDEFKKKQESTELTDASQLSLPDQSTELTDDSQLSRRIKEKEINTLNKKKETLPETPKSNPLSTLRLMDIKSKLGVIAKRWNQTYLEPSRSNIIYEKERTKFESSGYSISFDAYFDNALRMLEKLSTKPLGKYSPIRAVVTIESLLKFNMQQIKAIETWYNTEYPKAHVVRPIKVEEKLYDESRAGIPPTLEEMQRMCADVQ